MKSFPRLRRHLSGGDLAFIAVLIAAYLSMVSYLRRSFEPLELGLLIAASVAYLALGIWGFAYCKRAGSVRASLIYFVVQIPLAAAILQLSAVGLMFLIMLPLAGQSVQLLPRRWMIVVSAAVMLTLILPVLLRSGWTVAQRVGLMYLVGLVFVVVFTQIAVNERTARAEVERLAAQLREYAAQVEELAITKERNRVAREIHDSLGHYLTVINVQLEAARAVIGNDRERALENLSNAQALAQKGLSDVRRSVTALRASPVEDLPLTEALAKLVDECSAAGIATELVVTGAPRPLGPSTRLALYRAAQEGLTNVRKHSKAMRATLTLDYSRTTTVRLEVSDDGVGRRDGEEGFGLLGVRERAQLLSGQVRIRTAAGRGFTLEVELPG
jgi:signal transduction histidine kinase